MTKGLSALRLFWTLHQHGRLAEKRHPFYDKNRFAEYFMLFMGVFWAGYLIFFGVMMAIVMKGGAREPYHDMSSVLPFFFLADFLLRFALQQSTSQEMRPYMIMPVSRARLMDMLLLRSALSPLNLIWLFFFVPFALLSVLPFYGLWGVLTFSLGIWLLAVGNGFWYLLIRALVQENPLFWAIPVLFYGIQALLVFLPKDSAYMDLWTDIGEGYIQGSLLYFGLTILLLAILYVLDHLVLGRLVYSELANKKEEAPKNVTDYTYLEKYGQMGEYMKLELKLLMRNKVPRQQAYLIFPLVLVFSLMLSFSDVYEGNMRLFLVAYNFMIFGLLFLANIMSYEGNYIDGLMSRKESLYTLLRAKYTVYSLGLLIPLVLMIPVMVMVEGMWLTCPSIGLFTAGVSYCILMQLAVYNDRTTPLNVKLSGRKNMGGAIQGLITVASMFIPIGVKISLGLLVGNTLADVIMAIAGIVMIATNALWLKNIYKRFMQRRYVNMEHFRDSREAEL